MSIRFVERQGVATQLWKAYGLTTADRADRQRHLERELDRTELPFEVQVAERPTDAGGFASVGQRGCFESHLRALRAARDQDVDVAVIVEDDAVIVHRFPELLEQVQRELIDHDWSVLLLGYLPLESPSKVFSLELLTPHVARSRHWEFVGSHLYAVHRDALDALITDFERRLEPGGHRIGVDGILNEFRFLTATDTLVCVPNLSRQGPSPSGITEGTGLRTRLLHHAGVRGLVLAAKSVRWNAAAHVPARAWVPIWNLRARVLAGRRAEHAERIPGGR
jgi:glycosyl transferase, family 25